MNNSQGKNEVDGFVFFSFWVSAMLVVLIVSWVWFAFTKKQRVRWLLVAGWWILGVLDAMGRTSDAPFLIHIIATNHALPTYAEE